MRLTSRAAHPEKNDERDQAQDDERQSESEADLEPLAKGVRHAGALESARRFRQGHRLVLIRVCLQTTALLIIFGAGVVDRAQGATQLLVQVGWVPGAGIDCFEEFEM